MKKRFKFKCWNCHRQYTLFKEISDEQNLIVPCPFCSVEAVVKLDLYRKETKSVLKRETEDDHSIGFEYAFPEVIPTRKPEE